MYKFVPILKSVLWGGEKLIAYKEIVSDRTQIGESWELSGVAGSESVVAEGPDAGLSLSGLLARDGADLLGKSNYARFGNEFPLLVKFIDAKQDLSIQVHPNDALAWQRHRAKGKNEMWYVIGADPSAHLRCGFSERMTPETYEDCVARHALIDRLSDYAIRPGDVFFCRQGAFIRFAPVRSLPRFSRPPTSLTASMITTGATLGATCANCTRTWRKMLSIIHRGPITASLTNVGRMRRSSWFAALISPPRLPKLRNLTALIWWRSIRFLS